MKKTLLLLLAFCPIFAKDVVTTSIIPNKFFIEKIAGDFVDVNVMVPVGANIHTYEPKPNQMIQLSKSKIYFANGVEFEEIWVPKFKSVNKNLIVVNIDENVKKLDTVEHEHGGDHHHHDINVKTTDDFEDADVKDRPLSDWAGDWLSTYDYLLAGDLDEAFLKKAQKKDTTFEEMKRYYTVGYETDVDRILIDKDNVIHFTKDKKILSCHYIYDGFKILTYESGSRGVRYLFHCDDKDSLVPKFIQFSDHIVEPAQSEHFHIFMGDSSHEQLLNEMDNWPTFYPSSFSGVQIANDFLAHDSEHHDEDEHHHGVHDSHIWTDPLAVKIQARNIAKALSQTYPQNAQIFNENLIKFEQEIDELDSYINENLKDIKNRKFIIQHPSWTYFANRYNLVQIPIEFEGKDVKPARLANLIDTVNKEDIKIIITSPNFSQKNATAISNQVPINLIQVNELEENWDQNLKRVADIFKQNLQ